MQLRHYRWWAIVLFLAIDTIAVATAPGDFDDDGDVDLADFLVFEACLLNRGPGQSPFFDDCVAFDFDGDDDVDLADFVAFQNACTGSDRRRPPPTRVSGTSPTSGETGVAVTRETIVFFSAPIDAVTVDASSFFATFAGTILPARVHVSQDGGKATLFYIPDHLPASARVRVTLGLRHDSGGYAADR